MVLYAGDVPVPADFSQIKPAVLLTYAGVAQSILNATITPVTWDTVLGSTDGDMFTSPSDTIILTSSGLHLVSVCVSFAPHATGQRILYVRQNGTPIGLDTRNANAGGVSTDFVCTAPIFGVIGDAITIALQQTSTTTLGITPLRFGVVLATEF